MYYKELPEGTDVKAMKRLNIGYNDSYEMRSQYLPSAFFSDDPAGLEKILLERREAILAQAYKEMIEKLTYYNKVKDEIGNRNNAALHDSIDAPF